MYVFSKQEIREFLNRGESFAKQSLGQNYLVSRQGMLAICSKLQDGGEIIEIGAGMGNITINYFQNYTKVTLIEKDTTSIAILRENLTKFNNDIYPEWVSIIEADVMDIDITTYIDPSIPYQIIGALPYNIGKMIVRQTLSLIPAPQQCTFILQREVADKYMAKPPDANILSTTAELFATIKRHEILPGHDFYPVPKVDSRIITIQNFKHYDKESIAEASKESAFIKQCYNNPRKKLRNTLPFSVPEDLGNKRPQELSTLEWKNLFLSK